MSVGCGTILARRSDASSLGHAEYERNKKRNRRKDRKCCPRLYVFSTRRALSFFSSRPRKTTCENGRFAVESERCNDDGVATGRRAFFGRGADGVARGTLRARARAAVAGTRGGGVNVRGRHNTVDVRPAPSRRGPASAVPSDRRGTIAAPPSARPGDGVAARRDRVVRFRRVARYDNARHYVRRTMVII